jgi:hypothetical protein
MHRQLWQLLSQSFSSATASFGDEQELITDHYDFDISHLRTPRIAKRGFILTTNPGRPK